MPGARRHRVHGQTRDAVAATTVNDFPPQARGDARPVPADDYTPLHEYGAIGNCRTIALVSLRGSIDWFCLPHFSGPAVFAALLDQARGGRFRICPF